MKNNKTNSIKQIVRFLNNPEEDGGFWLPNIQRAFVWNENQICQLFDLILREYPISTLLVWKINLRIRQRRFIENWDNTLLSHLSHFYVGENDKKKNLVLDGQQRLQSFYIGLRGNFEGPELYFNILSDPTEAPDGIKYKFEFRTGTTGVFPWISFRKLVYSDVDIFELEAEIAGLAGRELIPAEHKRIMIYIDLVRRTFTSESAITYQELDSIDSPTFYGEDDVVEVFIRANSGGTRLGKSDLLFSLLAANWEVADQNMEILLGALNVHGFAFDRDFLKTCLVLIGEGARYEVSKFRKHGVRENIEEKWSEISKAIREVFGLGAPKDFHSMR